MSHPYPDKTRVYVAERGLGSVETHEYDFDLGLVYTVTLDDGDVVFVASDRLVLA